MKKHFEGQLKGKRLLLLGGSNNAPDIAKFAKESGIVLLMTSNVPNEKLNQICEESYEVDCTDVEGIVELITTQKIDGIFCAGNEHIITKAIEVCEILGLPFYSDRRLWDIANDKRKFKDLCKRYGVPAIHEYSLCKEDFEESAEKINYPVIIKPVDNCGSAGVSLCHSGVELKKAYAKALQYSDKKEVIIEDYILGDELAIYYTFSNGEVAMTSMCDKYLHKRGGAVLPLGDVYFYPSKYLSLYMEKIDEKMQDMLLGMGIKDGVVSVQGFYEKGTGNFQFFEIGYRLGGTSQHRYTDFVNGVNSLEMLMAYGLTGKMVGFSKKRETPYFKKLCCTFSLLSKGGVVGKVTGLEKLEDCKEIIRIENRYKEGDMVPITDTVAQFQLRFFCVADQLEQIQALIKRIHETVEVYDVNGDAMLEKNFDINRLNE